MLHRMRALLGRPVAAPDGMAGKVRDFLFSIAPWRVRYIVVDTGGMLPGRKVALAPEACRAIGAEAVRVKPSQEMIETGPPIDGDEGISRRMEEIVHRHFQWVPYWTEHGGEAQPRMGATAETQQGGQNDNSGEALQRFSEWRDRGFVCADREKGAVYDLILEDRDWSIPMATAQLGGRMDFSTVLVRSKDLETPADVASPVRCRIAGSILKDSSAYDPAGAVTEETLTEGYDQHGRPSDIL